MSLFELSIVTEVFGLDRPELEVPHWYSVDVCAIELGAQPVVGGVSLQVSHGVERIRVADTVIVPGWPVHTDVPSSLSDALIEAHDRGVRVVSICSGAFVLAAAGLLDGREAATHWQYADLLAQQYPKIRVNPDVLYSQDGALLTSAGSAAGIDLCLHLIRSDHGAGIANKVARRLVVPAHRDGGQAQFIERPVGRTDASPVNETISWMDRHLAKRVSVADLARRAHMSERHFTRQFRQTTGASPLAWLIARRIDTSLELLENSTESMETIAAKVGFANAVIYRHHFHHRVRTTPSAYRRAFLGRTEAAEPDAEQAG